MMGRCAYGVTGNLMAYQMRQKSLTVTGLAIMTGTVESEIRRLLRHQTIKSGAPIYNAVCEALDLPRDYFRAWGLYDQQHQRAYFRRFLEARGYKYTNADKKSRQNGAE